MVDFLSTFQNNFYPRPPRGGRPRKRLCLILILLISIHALREEGDLCLPTGNKKEPHFYPRPPRGGRHQRISAAVDAHNISIHALREEGDAATSCRKTKLSTFLSTPSARRATSFVPTDGFDHSGFLSTPSARRATPERQRSKLFPNISIHALREEGDLFPGGLRLLEGLISIHALREEGDQNVANAISDAELFLSTPSARRATTAELQNVLNAQFLSTPSARRATDQASPEHRNRGNFYPRPPRGGRLITSKAHEPSLLISIHALREEGDGRSPTAPPTTEAFLSTPSARRATFRAV